MKSSFFGPPKVFLSKIKETVYQLGKKITILKLYKFCDITLKPNEI